MMDCSVRGRDGREGQGTRTEGRPDASLRAKSRMRRKRIASCDPLKRIARHKAGRFDVFHVEQDRQRRSGITTWRDFSLLASRTRAEELASRSCSTTCSSRRADRASNR